MGTKNLITISIIAVIVITLTTVLMLALNPKMHKTFQIQKIIIKKEVIKK